VPLSMCPSGTKAEIVTAEDQNNQGLAVPSNFAMEQTWPFPSSPTEAFMKERRLWSTWCCCHGTGHATQRRCSADTGKA